MFKKLGTFEIETVIFIILSLLLAGVYTTNHVFAISIWLLLFGIYTAINAYTRFTDKNIDRVFAVFAIASLMSFGTGVFVFDGFNQVQAFGEFSQSMGFSDMCQLSSSKSPIMKQNGAGVSCRTNSECSSYLKGLGATDFYITQVGAVCSDDFCVSKTLECKEVSESVRR